MFNLSDDDSFSTQLEGKKLKNRGAKMQGAYKESHLLEIEKDAPGLMEEQEIEEGQEYFTDRELQKEGREERDERLKKEMAAARRQQQDMDKLRELQLNQNHMQRDPNLKLDSIEQGVMQSQNKGHKVEKQHFKQHNSHEKDMEQKQHEGPVKKVEDAITHAVLGEHAKNEPVKDNSIAAKMLPDIRGGGSKEHSLI